MRTEQIVRWKERSINEEIASPFYKGLTKQPSYKTEGGGQATNFVDNDDDEEDEEEEENEDDMDDDDIIDNLNNAPVKQPPQ